MKRNSKSFLGLVLAIFLSLLLSPNILIFINVLTLSTRNGLHFKTSINDVAFVFIEAGVPMNLPAVHLMPRITPNSICHR